MIALVDALVLLAVLVATAAAAWWWRVRDGRLRSTSDGLRPEELSALGAPQGVPLLLQFSAPGCRPCVTSWQVLQEIAAARPDVAVHAVDVADASDVVRTHGVLRAPTVFVIRRDGRVLARTSGVPASSELTRLVDADLDRVV